MGKKIGKRVNGAFVIHLTVARGYEGYLYEFLRKKALHLKENWSWSRGLNLRPTLLQGSRFTIWANQSRTQTEVKLIDNSKETYTDQIQQISSTKARKVDENSWKGKIVSRSTVG